LEGANLGSLEIRIRPIAKKGLTQKMRRHNEPKNAKKSMDSSNDVTAKKESIVNIEVTNLNLPAPNNSKKLEDKDISLRLYIKVDHTTNIVITIENLQISESFAELTLKKGSPDITRQPKREFPQKRSIELPKNS